GGAEVLGRGLGSRATVTADGDEALVRRVAAGGEPAPGVDRHAEAVPPHPGLALAGRVPVLLPPREFQGDVELFVVDVVPPAGPRDRVLGLYGRVAGRQVFAADDDRVDAELGRQVVDGELGED